MPSKEQLIRKSKVINYAYPIKLIEDYKVIINIDYMAIFFNKYFTEIGPKLAKMKNKTPENFEMNCFKRQAFFFSEEK